MSDDTDDLRRALLPQMGDVARRTIERGEQVWTTEQLRAEFDVQGFAAPCVVVRRKSDGAAGTLLFNHHPRIYFGWVADG